MGWSQDPTDPPLATGQHIYDTDTNGQHLHNHLTRLLIETKISSITESMHIWHVYKLSLYHETLLELNQLKFNEK